MHLLHLALRLNAASCVGFGLLFIALPGRIGTFLGQTSPAPAWAIGALGFGLVANGVALWTVARQPVPARRAVLVFSAGDFAWVIASIALIGTGIWIDTGAGIAAASAVALLVGALGALQLAGLRRPPLS